MQFGDFLGGLPLYSAASTFTCCSNSASMPFIFVSLKPGGLLAVSTCRVAQIAEILAVLDELGMEREQAPGWIAEPEKLSNLLRTAGFSDVLVRIDPHSFKCLDVEEYWQQARGTGLRRTLDNLNTGDTERLLTALRRRVCSGEMKGFSSVSTALIGLGRR